MAILSSARELENPFAAFLVLHALSHLMIAQAVAKVGR
jgi:hypothetical protein